MTAGKQTRAATGRRRDRRSGQSRATVRMDEWLFDALKKMATASGRSISEQCEMVLARYVEKKERL